MSLGYVMQTTESNWEKDHVLEHNEESVWGGDQRQKRDTGNNVTVTQNICQKLKLALWSWAPNAWFCNKTCQVSPTSFIWDINLKTVKKVML